MRSLINLATVLLFAAPVTSAEESLLREVENQYRNAKTVKMEVSKTLTMNLLKKEKKSKGRILIKAGGKLRWDTDEPTKSLVLMDGKTIWLVDYPSDPDEKISVLKARNPKKSQPHTVVAFLMGKGHISDDYLVDGKIEKGAAGTKVITLKSKSPEPQVKNLKLHVAESNKAITAISFDDLLGNSTTLEFSGIAFNEEIDNKVFQFKPPKNSEVTPIDN
jgi:outer membrane lipoprotein carrier protein